MGLVFITPAALLQKLFDDNELFLFLLFSGFFFFLFVLDNNSLFLFSFLHATLLVELLGSWLLCI